MSDLEKIEITRYRREIIEDVRHMVGKYARILAWDVPEADEGKARDLILEAVKDAVAQVEGEQR